MTLSPTRGSRVKEMEIVFVCTANRFRSPIAEAAVRELTAGLEVTVRSAGVLDFRSAGALPEAVRAASQVGLDVSTHRSRPLRESELAAADLVLGFERRHSMHALQVGGALPERVFTLPEFVALLPETDVPGVAGTVEQAREILMHAESKRSFRSFGRYSVPEIQDPVGAGRSTQRETAIRIRELSSELVSGLFGVDPDPAPGLQRRRTGLSLPRFLGL